MSAEASPDYGRLPTFQLTERGGKTVTNEQLEGSFWVANFIFTACPNQCPLMTAKFSLLQKTLPQNVRLVSFTVDPETDSPEKLSAYASGYRADSERWLFLTGKKSEIQRVLSGLNLGNGDDPNMHSLRFVLLGPKSQVLGYYNSEDSEALGQLNRDIKKWTALS